MDLQNAYRHKFWFEARLGNCDKMAAIQDEFKRFDENEEHPFSQWSLTILLCQKNYKEIALRAERYWDGYISSIKAYAIFFSYLFLTISQSFYSISLNVL